MHKGKIPQSKAFLYWLKYSAINIVADGSISKFGFTSYWLPVYHNTKQLEKV
jgi:hypothetical protein